MYKDTRASLVKREHRWRVSEYRGLDSKLPGASSSSRVAPRAASSNWVRWSMTRAGSMVARAAPLRPLTPLLPLLSPLSGVTGRRGETAASMMGLLVVQNSCGCEYCSLKDSVKVDLVLSTGTRALSKVQQLETEKKQDKVDKGYL